MDCWLQLAPDDFDTRKKLSWAKKRRSETLEAALDNIQRYFHPAAKLTCKLVAGELFFYVDERAVIEGVFVTASDTQFIFTQWDLVARTFQLSEKTTAKKLIDALRTVAQPNDAATTEQVLAAHEYLVILDDELFGSQTELNRLIYDAYGLSGQEIQMIEKK
jgi:hypothetical protein